MKFEKITNEILDKIDLEKLSKKIKNDEHRTYFLDKSSKEHYRLLSHISETNNKTYFLDVGTFKGLSALALAKNKSNFVYSFNLTPQLDLEKLPKNVEFIIGNIIDGNYKKMILKCKYILLDTQHTGEFEIEFYNYLKDIKYNGYLILDDIKLNKEMIDFWNLIDLPKKDISFLGHSTGTGVVFFN
jgi:hypothetical protein